MYDDHFRQFAKSLERVIAGYGTTKKTDRTEQQRGQVERLIQLEAEFRDALVANPWGAVLYQAFIQYIVDKRKNILAARPYFRERQSIFSEQISPAFRDRNHQALTKFRINYVFIRFVQEMSSWWDSDCNTDQIRNLAEDIRKTRQSLVDLNMPLAISRAKLFWSRTPRSHLEYMDLIQIGVEGLMNAVDKFVPPYTTVIRAVMIGRMTGNFIEEYTSPMLHFYPSDRKLLYRANKANRTAEQGDYQTLANAVNSGPEGELTTPSEIHLLMSAASHVSADAPPLVVDQEDSNIPTTTYQAPSSDQPDHKVEKAEAMMALGDAYQYLNLIEQKLLKMKGVDLNGFN